MLLHFFQALLLGIVQGITEPLPVSSTAHTYLLQRIFGLDQTVYGLTFDMFMNIGTTGAVIIFFWPKIKAILSSLTWPLGKQLNDKQRLPWVLLIATIPPGIVGLLLEKKIDSVFRSPLVIAFSLVVVGIVMLLAERRANTQKKLSSKPTDNQVYTVGASQILALLPGISRSGITVSTGLFLGLDRVTAAEYSFLLSIPITLAAILKRLVEFLKALAHHQVSHEVLAFYIVGAIASYITAYFTLRFLLTFYSRYSLSAFAYYRIVLALVIVALLL